MDAPRWCFVDIYGLIVWKKSVTFRKYIISLGDLDPSNLKPHQKVEVHARYLHAKYVRDR